MRIKKNPVAVAGAGSASGRGISSPWGFTINRLQLLWRKVMSLPGLRGLAVSGGLHLNNLKDE
jgi:hypothetical protein